MHKKTQNEANKPKYVAGLILLIALVVSLLLVCNMSLDSYAVAKHKYVDVVSTASNDDDVQSNVISSEGHSDTIPEVTTVDMGQIVNSAVTTSDELTSAKLQLLNQNLRDMQTNISGDVLRSQTCNQESWENAYGVKFSGCEYLKNGDQVDTEWKLWEDALNDGDLCIKTVGDISYAVANGEC